MKYKNTQKAYIPVGGRENVAPHGITRDYTDEEVQKNPDIRNALERGYLVKFDPAKHPLPIVKPATYTQAPAASKPQAKGNWVGAQDNEGGDRKVINKNGVKVEYFVADAEGVDGVSNPTEADVIAQLEGHKSVDFIEEGVDVNKVGEDGKPTWQTASEKFEQEITEETVQDVDYDDSATLAEREDDTERIPDADTEIEKDLTTFVRPQGNMGAVETTAEEMVKDAQQAAHAAVAEATKESFDEGEPVPAGTDHDVAEFLGQSFAVKKWGISKASDKAFLAKVVDATKSENVRSLAEQRLTELG